MVKYREIDLQIFIDEIYQDYKDNKDSKYVFFLGAGCSKSSNIPLAWELAKKWYEELKSEQPTKWKEFNKKNNINYVERYFEIFEKRFISKKDQQREIERITKNKLPSAGYYTLAKLMQEPQFNTVITTNFDDLIQDALIYAGDERALVITHENLYKFIERNSTPLIIKVHGDAHIEPFNSSSTTKEVPTDLAKKIKNLLNNTKVIFIGYGGNDESIAKLLEDCDVDYVYWLNKNEPKEVKISNWWNKLDNKALVTEFDFDKIMLAIKDKFNLDKPDFEKRAKDLEEAYKKSQEEESEALEEEIKQKDNKSAIDYFLLGIIYYQSKEYDKAIEAYEEAVKINPKDDSAYNNMGSAYANKKEYDKAIEAYKKAIEINPKYDSAYYNMGIAYDDKKEYDKAIDAFEKAIEINPKYADAYNNMGNAYYNKKEYDKAIEVYKKAIEINPKYADAYYNMGITYSNKKEYDKAIEVYKKAIEINPKYADAYYNMGIAYRHKKEYDKAIEAYKKAIEINPKYAKAYTNLFELYLTQNIPFDEVLESKYKELFSEDINKFIDYEMLKILEAISRDIEYPLSPKEWKQKYKGVELLNWGWDEIDEWLESLPNSEKKKKLQEAVEVFKNH